MEPIHNFEEKLEEKNYVDASKGKRFANYIIDKIMLYLYAIVLGLLFAVVLILIGNETYFDEMEESMSLGQKAMEWLLGLVMFIIFYTFIEYVFNGKTIGKLITGTRAVTEDNKKMDFNTTLIRTLCRLIPFEAFSFFRDEPRGWHDEFSNTRVIEDKGWSDDN